MDMTLSEEKRERRKQLRSEGVTAGAGVTHARADRDAYGHRSPEQVSELRELTSRIASHCADCFAPLASDASVTMVSRSIPAPPRKVQWSGRTIRTTSIRVPICLTCWLIALQDRATLGGERSHHLEEVWGPGEFKRCRCPGCQRPMRLQRTSSHRDLYLTERVCCDDCLRKAMNERARIRRRVDHDPIRCPVCRKKFTPSRADAVTCSNRCRQSMHRRRHR